MNRQAIYGFLLGVLVIGVAVIAFFAFVMPGQAPEPSGGLPSQQQPVAKEPATPAAAAPSTETEALEEKSESFGSAPPLFGDVDEPAGSGSAPDGADIGRSLSPESRERVEEIQAELLEISQSGTASPARVAQLIRDLRAELGTDEVGGVRLEQLEATVERAGRIQELANEMQSLSANPTKADRARIQDIMSEIQHLQRGIPDDPAAYGVPGVDGQ